MSERRFFMLQVKTDSEFYSSHTLTEVAYRTGLHPELIDRFISLGLIEFTGNSDDGEPFFDSEVIPLIRRILRLRNELGVNYAGIGVILDLISRLEVLEARIRDLESAPPH
ncbi:MAG: chaperone modulator CbpM [Syntrophobacteraceae bacterium]|jgi:DNA-binding transcriptional MerR regulator